MPDVTGSIQTAKVSAARVTAPPSAAPKTNATSVAPQIQRISPAIRFDPASGVMVTEYYDGNGKVQTQLPSAASIAYLRVGLTATGESPRKTDAPATEESPNVVA
ncbi:MAG: hypothetical protein PHY92_04950 [Alphaproteobacteria bacterium]|nr:hypothetical protein [Alphaproteobacteria bacterium]